MRHRSLRALAGALVLLAAACSSEEAVTIDTARVVRGEVVQTVAAAAELQAADRATVTAPVGGEVAEVLVRDGDVVQAGDPVVRLESDSIDQQVSQAAAAVEAAEALASASAAAGFDLSPVVGAFRSQLDAVFPPLIATLRSQLDAVEVAAEELATAVPDTVSPDVDALDADALVSVRDGLDGLEGEDGRDGQDGEHVEDGQDGQGGQDGTDAPQQPEAPDLGDVEIPLPEVDLSGLDEAVAEARARVAETEAGYLEARAGLGTAERQAREQAAAAAAGQRAAAGAQREQAELALEAARARIDDLTILAPVSGVVELARADPGQGASGSPSVGDLGTIPGDLDAGALGDLGGLLGGAPDGNASSGPVSQGVAVSTGQPLLTIFDLSGFTARASIDEIDVVEVEVGQPVELLVTAFPDASIGGIVTHVALAPEPLAGGGSVYPVTIDLRTVPEDVALRVGLTASAEIEVRRIVGDTVVPTSALLRRGGDEVVHVVRDGIVREVPVTVAAIGDDTAAVQGAVDTGERVVTVGVELVEDGDELDVGSS